MLQQFYQKTEIIVETMTALVTGATGFVGAAVARKLVSEGITVRALVREAANLGNLQGLGAELAVGDLNDPESIRRAVAECDVVFHVAADYRLWARNPFELLKTNVEGTRNVIRAACDAGVDRIVYTSSVATLGIHPDGTPADEETPVSLADMIGIYKRSKYLAEREAEQLVRQDGAPVVIVNPSTPIGPGDIKPTPTGRIIVEAATGKIPAFVDTGLNVVHVDDVANGHILAWRKGVIGEKYILGGEDMTLAEILAEIAHLSGRRPPTVSLPHNAVLPIAWCVEQWTRMTGGDNPFVTVDGVKMAKKTMFFSSDRARRQLGYSWRPAAEALADAVAWFRDHGYLEPRKAAAGA